MAQQRKKAEPAPPAEGDLKDHIAAAQESDEDKPLDAVIIVKTVTPDGNFGTQVILNGDVKPTEVQTIIEFGLKGWRSQLGLAD